MNAMIKCVSAMALSLGLAASAFAGGEGVDGGGEGVNAPYRVTDGGEGGEDFYVAFPPERSTS